ncbi:hypothetical protein FN846DRAFT_893813 [Sphaerosporella brunnea]|uniref:Uncharacterized protein n=1 Tax=Sphaerosporella brunnea TaxID=1250544 RepID=A0A5J5EL08_9PEZI|nr:hypothetical protein FN846DRAFT_893813 [Sphaerosporella brunnea]
MAEGENRQPVASKDVTKEFYDFNHADLAPLEGAFAINYTWFCHNEKHAHQWRYAWTTERNLAPNRGGNFHVAEYGIKVESTKNMFTVWQRDIYHGPTLAHVLPSDNEVSSTRASRAASTQSLKPSGAATTLAHNPPGAGPGGYPGFRQAGMCCGAPIRLKTLADEIRQSGGSREQLYAALRAAAGDRSSQRLRRMRVKSEKCESETSGR